MRKRGIWVLVGVALIALAFIFGGAGVMLAFIALLAVGGMIVLVTKLYPSSRHGPDDEEGGL